MQILRIFGMKFNANFELFLERSLMQLRMYRMWFNASYIMQQPSYVTQTVSYPSFDTTSQQTNYASVCYMEQPR